MKTGDRATFETGAVVRLTAEFRDLAGALTDPDSVTFRLRAPDGTLTVYTWPAEPEVVRAAAGRFHLDWPVAAHGPHRYRWESSGAAQAAAEGEFVARKSRVLP